MENTTENTTENIDDDVVLTKEVGTKKGKNGSSTWEGEDGLQRKDHSQVKYYYF